MVVDRNVTGITPLMIIVWNTTNDYVKCLTRSQAVARIADRTASQHLIGSHVTSLVT